MTLHRLLARPFAPLLVLAAALTIAPAARSDDAKAAKPLRGLLVTGGGYHDYKNQKAIVTEGVSARAPVEWTIVDEESKDNGHKVSLYADPNWAKGYDVVVHNECFAAVTDLGFIENVLKPHREGTPAVVIHCTMHTFRDLKSDEWREFLGVTTRRHGPQHPLEVKNLMPEHPIMKGFPSVWTTGNEELYAIEKVWPNAVPLAQAYAIDNKKDHTVIWTNTYGKGRVFGTTLAHSNATMKDPVYLDMLTRGILWATDHIEANGQAKPGYAAPSTK